LRTRTKVI